MDDQTDGLNGCLFPFPIASLNKDQLVTVGCAFAGDDPEIGQRVFDFLAYDFSCIPFETRSVIYEQFLHEPIEGNDTKRGKSKSAGRYQGVYYNPMPLVNFIISEMKARKRLLPGMEALETMARAMATLMAGAGQRA